MEKLVKHANGQWSLEKGASAGSLNVPDPIKRKRKDVGESTQYAGPSPDSQLNKAEEISFNEHGQWSLNKSNYGPKKMKLYSPVDNAKRKMSNTGQEVDIGPNKNVKQYAPTGLSAKQQADAETKRYNKLNRKQPVKVFSAEEIEEYKKKKAP